MAIVMLGVLAVGVRAEEGIVLPKAPGVIAMSNNNERRPPQAPPPDPSKNPDAPPDFRGIKRAVGGFVGGLIGFGSCSLLKPPKRDSMAACVSIGIVVGALAGGR